MTFMESEQTKKVREMDLDEPWNRKLDHVENSEDLNKEGLIHILNNDCLTKIFMYLPFEKRLEIEKVCSRWRDVSSERAWYDMKELDASEIHDNLLQKPNTPLDAIQWYLEQFLIRGGQYLLTLSLCSPCESSLFFTIGKHCPNLRNLELDMKNIYIQEECYKVLAGMEKLRCLKINHYWRKDQSDVILDHLNDRMEELYLNRQAFVREINVEAESSFRRFEELRSVTMNRYIIGNDIVKAICHKKYLVHLDLSYSFCNLPGSLLSNLTNLEYLDLRQVNELDDDIVADLVKCKKLKYLDMSYNFAVTDHSIREIAKLEHLRDLSVNNNTNVTDTPFGQLHMRKLRKIKLRNCRRIGNLGIIKLLKNLPNLELLDLVGTSVTSETVDHALNGMSSRKNKKFLKLSVNRNLHYFIDSEKMPSFLVIL